MASANVPSPAGLAIIVDLARIQPVFSSRTHISAASPGERFWNVPVIVTVVDCADAARPVLPAPVESRICVIVIDGMLNRARSRASNAAIPARKTDPAISQIAILVVSRLRESGAVIANRTATIARIPAAIVNQRNGPLSKPDNLVENIARPLTIRPIIGTVLSRPWPRLLFPVMTSEDD